MIYEFGDMWSVLDSSNGFCITTNSSIKHNGELVMGKGIAGQAKRRFPDLPRIAGKLVSDTCGDYGTYGVIRAHRVKPYHWILLFQTKADWKNPSSLALIGFSVKSLVTTALRYPDMRFDLAYPGINNGKLSVSQVEPLLQPLPDNVHIWRFK